MLSPHGPVDAVPAGDIPSDCRQGQQPLGEITEDHHHQTYIWELLRFRQAPLCSVWMIFTFHFTICQQKHCLFEMVKRKEIDMI